MIEFKPYASSSKGNLFTIDDGTTKLGIECGLAWPKIRQLLNFKTTDLQGILLSHSHFDHSKGIAEALKAGIDVWTSQETIKALGITGCYVHPIEPLKEFTIGSWNVLGFDTLHDAPGSLGFLLTNSAGEKFLFAIDTPYLKYKFHDLCGIAIGCNYDADLLNESIAEGTVDRGERHRLIHAHASLQTVKEMLTANDLSKVQGIWLLHLSSRNADAARFKKEIQELTGQVVHLPDE